MPSRHRILSFTAVCSLGLALGISSARADATVVVELKTKEGAATDGVVELQQGEKRHACTTKAGTCELTGVAGGMYTVVVKVPNQPSPKPKQVMIPPSGEVKLVVNAS